MNIEAELTRRVPAGAKLHTGRSRNDQVALDVRLWLRDEITPLLIRICGTASGIGGFAGAKATSLFPAIRICNGPNRFISRTICSPMSRCLSAIASASWDCHSPVSMFVRSGSGAIGGQSRLPLKRELVAKLLGFVDERGRPRVSRKFHGRCERPRLCPSNFAAAAALLAVHFHACPKI